MDEKPYLGVDMALAAGDLVALASGDVGTVSGTDCVVQDLRIRLATPRGDLWSHPDWGVAVLRFLQSEDTPLNRLDMCMEIERAVQSDPRVAAGSAKAEVLSWGRDSIRVSVTCRVVSETNPLNLVLGYGTDVITVEGLRGLENAHRP
jgi:phage baseplate assembly protein W